MVGHGRVGDVRAGRPRHVAGGARRRPDRPAGRQGTRAPGSAWQLQAPAAVVRVPLGRAPAAACGSWQDGAARTGPPRRLRTRLTAICSTWPTDLWKSARPGWLDVTRSGTARAAARAGSRTGSRPRRSTRCLALRGGTAGRRPPAGPAARCLGLTMVVSDPAAGPGRRSVGTCRPPGRGTARTRSAAWPPKNGSRYRFSVPGTGSTRSTWQNRHMGRRPPGGRAGRGRTRATGPTDCFSANQLTPVCQSDPSRARQVRLAARPGPDHGRHLGGRHDRRPPVRPPDRLRLDQGVSRSAAPGTRCPRAVNSGRGVGGELLDAPSAGSVGRVADRPMAWRW